MFGDLGTSSLPVVLSNTCGGSVELIKSMILNKKIDDYFVGCPLVMPWHTLLLKDMYQENR
jgi:hypothetical protein